MTAQSPSSASATPPPQAGSQAVRAGTLEVRLARNEGEIAAAQALRYRVFYQEMGAHPTVETALVQRDFDDFDAFCDHLLVFDHARGAGNDAVVGTYRLIRREAAARVGRFYSAAEYDLRCVAEYPGAVLELGRSCIDPQWRTRPTMQLLWRGIAAYVFDFGIELMFGCASLPGTDPNALAVPLSYLYHHHLAPPALRPRALSDRYLDMNRLPADAFDPAEALNQLPPLLKGYLRLGGFVGDGAVIDQQFNTTDVCIVVKTDLVTEKYYRHYERRVRAVAAA
ncbi:MAG: GNAT family N-acetyltransferase [Alphaproteobacteria bacterium]|nr:GNAT family N-acetyltransferase [Alphaproteobacteria bacterium]MDE1902761.1 GNAT family N-acetyltransferase [Alphaproteobacteria bacterium]